MNNHRRIYGLVSLGVAAAMLLGSCGESASPVVSTRSGETDPVSTEVDSTAAVVVDGEVDVEALNTQLAAFVELSPEDQEAQLAEVDGRLERELWTLSGLEAALGGPEAADAVFAEHSEAIVSRARAIGDQPIVMSGLRRSATAPAGPSIGGALFGGMLVVVLGADGIVSSSNDFKDGQTATGKVAEGVTVSASREHAEMSVDATEERSGVTTKLGIKLSVNPCPDASGHFEGKATIDISATTTGGSTGQKGTLDVTITGQVDDDAKLA
ncbi:MAG: hypothetical protein M3P52_03150, partial [Actinomycetota bacterium]|nr:hypothetical protein [Actinomycetota bacterium]